MNEEEAFLSFRKRDLDELDFIPNVEELWEAAHKALRGKCCGSPRRQAINKQREIFGEAFRAANQ